MMRCHETASSFSLHPRSAQPRSERSATYSSDQYGISGPNDTCEADPPLFVSGLDGEACMKTILAPLDGSAVAEQVLPYIPLLAGTLAARVHLLVVLTD